MIYMENFGSLILPLLLSALVGYLLGSISFAILLTKAFAHEDVRAHGSGNAGATNVLRVAGKKASALTFLLDFCKCVASVLVGYFLVKHACVANGVDPEMARLGMYAAGFCCMIGHMYPLYFGFRGGKGILSGGTIVLMLDWRVALVAWGLFVVLWLSTKYVSLGSIAATASMPVTTFFVFSHNVLYTVLSAAIAALVIWCHRGNIQRLLSGTEKKFKWHVNPIREDDGK